jgi:hypothetical protein
MFRIAVAITIICVSLPGIAHTQDIEVNASFRDVDSFSRTVRYKHDLYLLTKELTDRYTEQLQKARAIFIWITENIEYDYNFINKGKEVMIPECDPGVHCEQLQQDWERKYLNRVLRRKKAICDGYARLYKKMCGIAGIPCEIVAGYTKTKPYQIGNAGSVDHDWNAIYIDSTWHFLDPTWAAGGCGENEDTGELLPFKKGFSEYYWCTPFDKFYRNHYPKDGKWVMESGYTKEKYAANPYYVGDIISDINLVSPASGIIKTNKGDTLHFRFDYKRKISLLQINSNVFRNPSLGEWEKKPWHRRIWIPDTTALRKQRYVPFHKSGDTYEFDYIVTDGSLYYLELLFDSERTMRFNVTVNTPESTK